MKEAASALTQQDVQDNSLTLGHLALALGLVLVGMGQTLLYALLGPATRQIGLSELQTGAIVSASALVLTVASPFWGRRIDKIGSRFVFLVGMFSYAVGSVAFAMALDAGSRAVFSATLAFATLVLIRVVYAFMTAGIHPAAMANIALTTAAEMRPARMALMSACFGVGSTLGPLLGSALGGFGLLVPLYAVSGMALLSVLFGSVALKRNDALASANRSARTAKNLSAFDRRVLPPLIATVLTYVGFSALQQSLSFHVQDLLKLDASEAVKQTGVVVSGLAAAMVVTQLGILQYVKPKPKMAVSVGATLTVVGLIGIATWADSMVKMTACSVFCGAGFAFTFPGLQSALSSSVEEAEQGSVAGLSFGAAALGYVVGPLLGTGLLSVGHGITYWCAAVLVMLAAFASQIRNS